MKPSLQRKLESLVERHQEITALLSDADVIADQTQFRALSKELAQLSAIADTFSHYQATLQSKSTATVLLQDADAGMRAMAQEELEQLEQKEKTLSDALQTLLLPQDPNDHSNVFLEIRAAAGGDEAAIFAGDLFRMYSRYAESRHWHLEIINENLSEQGGYKSIVARIAGQDVYAQLKFESGAHRVQRVPETEAQGRIHTSTCTVAIIPEIEEVDSIDINPADLKVDTFRASGAGGQHVNKTDSAIRITHLPTGTVVECQDERSQHKNRARAMKLLQSKLLTAEQEKQRTEQAENRRNLVGTGDRSERIRTYNFPQGRLTDHRINLTLYKLSTILDGDLAPIIEPLIQEHQADLLSMMSDE